MKIRTLLVVSIFFLFTLVAPTEALAVVQSLNGQTGQTQTFSNDANVTISSSSNVHSLGWQGLLPLSRGGTGASSFTAGSILFSNGTSLVQDNSDLFWDDINNRLAVTNLTSTNDATIHTLTAGMGGGSNDSNTAFGINALLNNTTGYLSTAVGYGTLAANAGGIKNTAVGSYALNNSYGESNTAIGSAALRYNTSGSYNTALGSDVLVDNTTGTGNVALGPIALYNNISGNDNVAAGFASLSGNTTGAGNTAVGWDAMSRNVTGSGNVALGYGAAKYQADGFTNLTTANDSIYIGDAARGYDNSDSNSIVIGSQAIGAGFNKAVIGNSSVTDVYFGSSNGNSNIHGKKLYLGSSSTPGCIIMGDTAGGVGYITLNSGVLTVSTTAPSACQ